MPLHTTDHGAVRLLALDRPERKNAFDQPHYQAMAAALAAAAEDETVHVVVVTGRGDVFSAGQDLQEMARLASGEAVSDGPADGFPRMLEQLESFSKPLLAAVNGAATGVGMTMLLHCDLVLVADTARLRVPFAELGVPPEAGSSALLADLIGWQRAAELLLTSRWVTGPEAADIGLALRCVPADDLHDDVMRLAQQIAAHAPFATRSAKQLMLAARGDRSRAARAREEALFAELFARGPR